MPQELTRIAGAYEHVPPAITGPPASSGASALPVQSVHARLSRTFRGELSLPASRLASKARDPGKASLGEME